jgi:DNA-binding PadR family transcriptional regulator
MTSSDLDLFLLALVQSGLATPYDLKAKAGLSVGSTAPVLKRLENGGLIYGAKRGKRNSRRFEITKSGQKKLKSDWQALLEGQPTDFDTILRIIYIAWLLGRRDVVVKVIDKSASTLKNIAATRTAEANQLRPVLGLGVTGETFRWLRTFTSAARLKAEGDALLQVSKAIAGKRAK